MDPETIGRARPRRIPAPSPTLIGTTPKSHSHNNGDLKPVPTQRHSPQTQNQANGLLQLRGDPLTDHGRDSTGYGACPPGHSHARRRPSLQGWVTFGEGQVG